MQGSFVAKVLSSAEINSNYQKDKDGMFAIDFRYTNVNGPTNTENKCANWILKDGEKGSALFC